jgi:hypothetical protein
MYLKNKKSPGERLVNNLSLKHKWLACSAAGLILVGLGLCIFSEAAHIKHSGKDTATWVLLGTLSLVIINTGLAIFGKGVVYKTEIRVKKRLKERDKRMKENKKRFQNSPIIEPKKNPQN